MKAYRLLFFVFLPAFTYAQTPPNGFGNGYSDVQNGFSGLRSFFNVVNSEPITAPNNAHQLNGSPYFSDVWMKGIITLGDGKSYRGDMMRIDLLNTRLFFINNQGQEQVCISPVEKVLLLDSINNRVHSFVHSFTLRTHPDLEDSVWLEVLQAGKAQLLKMQKKELVEKSTYASTPQDVIKTQMRYYLVMDEHLYKVTSFRDLRNIFIARKTEFDAYMNKQNPSWKYEADIVALVAYFNSLNN